MSSYRLNIQFSSRDAKKITAAGQKVTLVKSVRNGGAKVTWVTFEPFNDNTVEWRTQYGLYSSTQEVMNGARISQSSTQNPADSGLYYPFEDNAFGDPTGRTPKRNDYGIHNLDGRDLTFGLTQAARVRGTDQPPTPLNAVPVFQAETATFTPIEEVKVFLQSHYNNGVIITRVASRALPVDLTQNPDQTIHYNDKSGRFEPGPLV
ncbi:MAG: hypothetical protein AAF657_11765 [Acidobacteriota bacterium]